MYFLWKLSTSASETEGLRIRRFHKLWLTTRKIHQGRRKGAQKSLHRAILSADLCLDEYNSLLRRLIRKLGLHILLRNHLSTNTQA
jgi:hypothetical protein